MLDDKKTIRVVAAAIHNAGKVLIGQRPEGGVFGLKWEFPGGKIEPGESPEQALVREIQEELDLIIRPLYSLGQHVYTGETRKIELDVYWAEPTGPVADVRRREHLALAWVDSSNIGDFDFALPDVPFHLPVVLALTGQRSLC